MLSQQAELLRVRRAGDAMGKRKGQTLLGLP